MAYLWWKAVHIIAMVAWFAGLFYLVRLFIYHAEAREGPADAQRILFPQYELMERRLYYIITYPAMVLTVVTAAALLVIQPAWLQQWWMWPKLAVGGLLIGYHYWCEVTMKRMAAGQYRFTSQQLRWANEGPTLLLIVGVALAVLKNQLPVGSTTLVMVGITLLFAVSIRMYAKARRTRGTRPPMPAAAPSR